MQFQNKYFKTYCAFELIWMKLISKLTEQCSSESVSNKSIRTHSTQRRCGFNQLHNTTNIIYIDQM